MRWLLFLSRLAFICGVFFIIAVTLLIKNWVNDPTLESTIITIGYTMGLIIFPRHLYLLSCCAGSKKEIEGICTIMACYRQRFFLSIFDLLYLLPE